MLKDASIVVAHNVGQDEDNGKDNAEPALLERILHIVGRAAVISAVGILNACISEPG